ncbi:MAG: transglycosylase domain-containing protein [Syntrophomonadaceae bacterium]|jgi:1A family penicillin-binding protein
MRRKIILICIVSLVLAVNLGFTWKLPTVELPQASVVYDVNGRVINGLTPENRISVSLNEISPYFIDAIIAVEDKNFYRHHGIDIIGIARAVLVNLRAGKVVEGGSTITQQTAKNIFLTNERTFTRKLKELFYALQLERQYSKDEILAMYCNSIYFGQGAYGVETAARTFFSRSAQDLTLAQAALLAGIPRWPEKYNPYSHPEDARQRQRVVLKRMVAENKISEQDRSRAAREALVYSRAANTAGEAPYFVSMVKDYVSRKYGERMVYQGGLHIFTTLDLDMQKAANNAYNEGMKNRDSDLQAALVGIDVENGQIRALIGGRDFSASSYNRAYSNRQPGSTFKPFMYSLAMQTGFTPAHLVKCEEVKYHLSDGSRYVPTDYGDVPYHDQEFTLKEAVMISDNVIAVQVNDILNPRNTAAWAKKFGFADIQPVLSLPLGSNEVSPVDMAAGYAVFANQGVYNQPQYILKVVDSKGRVLEENKNTPQRIISAENAYVITNMLQGVLEPGGTGAALKSIVNRSAAAKTGTTDEFRDAWFVGYTPQLCCAVWVGYDTQKKANLTGGAAAGPIWAAFIRDASSKLPERDFIKPQGVTVMNICLDSGQIASESCPRQIDMAFQEGTQPEDVCYLHSGSLESLFERFKKEYNRVGEDDDRYE